MSSTQRVRQTITSALRRVRVAAHRVGLSGDGVSGLRRRVEGIISSFEPRLEQHDIPGAAVVVRLSDGSRIERYLGWADRAAKHPMSAGTLFQAMSLTKPLTSLVMVRLAEDGLLDLDVPVARYLRSWTLPSSRCEPGCDFEGVTLRRVLSHTAGFNQHGFGWAPAGASHPAGAVQPSAAALLEGAAGEALRLVTPPGEVQRYSGGGYALAQVVAEDVCGERFPDIVRRVVFAPMGLALSSMEFMPGVASRLATRYEHVESQAPIGSSGALLRAAAMPRAVVASCGASGWYAAPTEVCTFMETFLASDSSRPSAWQAEMTRPQGPRDRDRSMGLGFHLWLRRSDTIFAHRGYFGGWWSEAAGMLRRRSAVVVMSNGDSRELAVKALSTALRQCILDHAL
ncbi:MAG: serine hydrolase domain-containing protein [Phycisphaerales bacterium]